MENEHVLSGLIRKRAEIAGQLEASQMQVRQLIIDIDSLDATIRLFAPDFDLAALRPKHIAPPHVAFHGQVARILLDVLREAREPITVNDAARFVMERRGLNASDPRLVVTVQRRVGASLRNLRKRGTVRSRQGDGRVLAWTLANL